jgi:signal transduction histidine kinase
MSIDYRGSAHKLEVENIEFSLLDLLDEVLDVFRERSRSKGIYLRIQVKENTPSRVVSDPARLRQILINIVGNAVKFTEHGGVYIHVASEETLGEKSKFSFIVKDTGVGLSEEQRNRLFQPFVQADNSTTRRFGGTGLGLALSQRLAGALGGSVTAENGPSDEGCTFVITFVAKAAADLPLRVLANAKLPNNQRHGAASLPMTPKTIERLYGVC